MNKEIHIPLVETPIDDLVPTQKEIVNAAIEAAKSAYAPYSHFRVGASVLLSNGKVINGSNQENAAYPSGICAERTALFYANATYPEAFVVSMAVVAIDAMGTIQDSLAPCGSCRQVMVEVSSRYNKPFEVILVGNKTCVVVSDNRHLLPLTFDASALLGKKK